MRHLIFLIIATVISIGSPSSMMANDIYPIPTEPTGYLKKDVDPDLPMYPHKPSKFIFSYVYSGSEVSIYCNHPVDVEAYLSDSITGEIYFNLKTNLQEGITISIPENIGNQPKITVIFRNSIYSAILK